MKIERRGFLGRIAACLAAPLVPIAEKIEQPQEQSVSSGKVDCNVSFITAQCVGTGASWSGQIQVYVNG